MGFPKRFPLSFRQSIFPAAFRAIKLLIKSQGFPEVNFLFFLHFHSTDDTIKIKSKSYRDSNNQITPPVLDFFFIWSAWSPRVKTSSWLHSWSGFTKVDPYKLSPLFRQPSQTQKKQETFNEKVQKSIILLVGFDAVCIFLTHPPLAHLTEVLCMFGCNSKRFL